MRYSFEEFIDMAKRYPALDMELRCFRRGVNRDFDNLEKRDQYQYVCALPPSVIILADWEYNEDGDNLIAESRFSLQGKPAARIIMSEDSCHLKYNIRQPNGSYGPDKEAYSDAPNYNRVYTDMGESPYLKFPSWDKSEASTIYSALKKNGCLKDYAADFLYHDRDFGLRNGFRNVLIFARDSGTEFLVNNAYYNKILNSRQYNPGTHVAYFSGSKLKIETLPEGLKERSDMLKGLLQKLPPMEDLKAGTSYAFANTEDDSHISVEYVSEKRMIFWAMQEKMGEVANPYANVEHENIVGRSQSPKP